MWFSSPPAAYIESHARMTSFVGMFYRTNRPIFPPKNQTKTSGPKAFAQKCFLCNAQLILDGNLIFHFTELSCLFVLILLSFANSVYDSTAHGIIHVVSNLKGPKISTDPTNIFHSWQFIPLETIISCVGLCPKLLENNTLPWPLDHHLAWAASPFLQPDLPC